MVHVLDGDHGVLVGRTIRDTIYESASKDTTEDRESNKTATYTVVAALSGITSKTIKYGNRWARRRHTFASANLGGLLKVRYLR